MNRQRAYRHHVDIGFDGDAARVVASSEQVAEQARRTAEGLAVERGTQAVEIEPGTYFVPGRAA